jgi:Na+-transporting NADH:ubiquinone oxidoreductase subunit A
MTTHTIKKGLDLPITGAPRQEIGDGPRITRAAIIAGDFVMMKPRMSVQVGDTVKRGQILFEDRKQPGVFYTAPGAGTVEAINRGARRALQSVVIALNEAEVAGTTGDDDHQAFEAWKGADPAGYDRAGAVALLVESGLWTALRERPFGRVPSPEGTPAALFINGMDSNPLAADPDVVVAGHEADLQRGVDLLAKLADRTWFCKRAGSKLSVQNAKEATFAGPHPSGLVGTHIHFLDPVHREKSVWHLSYADVIAVGQLVATGKLPVDRVVALAGPMVKEPRLVRTRLGASVDELLEGQTADGELRFVSGSALYGAPAQGPELGYVGRYSNQVTVLREDSERHLLGWLNPGLNHFSILPAFLYKLFGRKEKLPLGTNTQGSPRAMVPIGMYEDIMPLDIMPTHLLRALCAGDVERAEQLGMLELDEEDLALCTVVCPGKTDYGALLRDNLRTVLLEG